MENLAKWCHFPAWGALIPVAALFICAYIFYWISLFSLKKLGKKSGFLSQFVKEIRLPLLLFLFELAAIISLELFDFHGRFLKMATHILIVLMIATLGWFAAGTLRAYFRNYTSRVGFSEKAKPAARSLLTQLLFLYRIAMFLICVLTAAAILLTFPYIKNVGIGILGSAGIAGIALGVAARPILLNLMAGFQIAMTKSIKLGDTVFIEGDSALVEAIHLTHIVCRTWDLRRIIIPISYFIDKPFQNWEAVDLEIHGVVLLYCDYSLPMEMFRKKTEELLQRTPYWNKKSWNVHITDCTEKTMEVRIYASANDAASAFELRAFLREKLIDYIQKEYPSSLPCARNLNKNSI